MKETCVLSEGKLAFYLDELKGGKREEDGKGKVKSKKQMRGREDEKKGKEMRREKR